MRPRAGVDFQRAKGSVSYVQPPATVGGITILATFFMRPGNSAARNPVAIALGSDLCVPEIFFGRAAAVG